MKLWIQTLLLGIILGLAAVALAIRYYFAPEPVPPVVATTEAAVLEHQGVEVIAAETVADLEKQVADLVANNKDLQIALQAARKAAAGAKVIQIVNASTGPILAEDPPESTCLLKPNDEGEIKVQEIQLQTKAGNKILIGTAEAWRLEPRQKLFGGPFSASVTEAGGWPGDLIDPAKWGYGIAGFYSGSGFVPGLVLAAPPVKFWGVEVIPLLAAGWGAGLAAVAVRP